MRTVPGKSFFAMVCLALAVSFPGVCNAAKTHITKVTRIAAPPAGKALVNIQKGNFGGFGNGIRCPIFDDDGTFLMDLPGDCECQLVCEPGQKTFITWFEDSPICVLTADLAPDKIYDLLIDRTFVKITFVPFSKDPAGKKKLQKFEKRHEKKVFTLTRDETALNYESSQKAHIEQIKHDFLGGGKSDRVIQVHKDDCR